MGVGAGLYMCDVVKKVHVRYLISWWVLVFIEPELLKVVKRVRRREYFGDSWKFGAVFFRPDVSCYSVNSVKALKGTESNDCWLQPVKIIRWWLMLIFLPSSIRLAREGHRTNDSTIWLRFRHNTCRSMCAACSEQELISRWDSERERFYDDIVHVEDSAYAHWTDFLSMLIYAAANHGRSSASFIILRCDCELGMRLSFNFVNV